MDPVSMMIMSGVAGTAQAVGQLKQGNLAMENAKRDAKITLARNDSDAAATLESMRRRRRESNRQLSAIKARMMDSGVITTSGSSADFLETAGSRLELGILDEATQQSYRDRGARQTADGQLYQGEQAKTQSRFASVSTLLGTGAKVANQYGVLKEQSPGGVVFPKLEKGVNWLREQKFFSSF